jgi:glutaredoxin
MIRVRFLKRRRREVKVDPKLGGQWKVPCLVANGRFHAWWLMECSKLGGHGRFHAWWPMECSKLGGQRKVPCLVANGR